MQAPATQKTVRRATLLAKIALLVGGALLAFAIAVGAVTVGYFSGVLRGEALERGRAASRTLAAAVSALPDLPPAATNAMLASARKEANLAYIEIVGPAGN